MSRGSSANHVSYGVVDIPEEGGGDGSSSSISSRRKMPGDSKYARKMSRFTAKSMEERFNFEQIKSDDPIRSAANYVVKYYKPSPVCMKNYFFARFPFFDWIRTYSVKENLAKDLIAGLTVSGILFSNYCLLVIMTLGVLGKCHLELLLKSLT